MAILVCSIELSGKRKTLPSEIVFYGEDKESYQKIKDALNLKFADAIRDFEILDERYFNPMQVNHYGYFRGQDFVLGRKTTDWSPPAFLDKKELDTQYQGFQYQGE